MIYVSAKCIFYLKYTPVGVNSSTVYHSIEMVGSTNDLHPFVVSCNTKTASHQHVETILDALQLEVGQ